MHLSDGVDFLGFRSSGAANEETVKWYVHTFVGTRPIRSVKAKVRALTRKTSQQNLRLVLHRLSTVLRGWAYYFRHAVATDTFQALDNVTWWRVVHMLRTRHRWGWKEFRRRYTTPTGRWLAITAGSIELARISAIPVTRYRYRGGKIPTPWVTGTA